MLRLGALALVFLSLAASTIHSPTSVDCVSTDDCSYQPPSVPSKLGYYTLSVEALRGLMGNPGTLPQQLEEYRNEEEEDLLNRAIKAHQAGQGSPRGRHAQIVAYLTDATPAP